MGKRFTVEERQQQCIEQRKRSEELFRETMLLIMDSKVKIAEATILIEPYTGLLEREKPLH